MAAEQAKAVPKFASFDVGKKPTKEEDNRGQTRDAESRKSHVSRREHSSSSRSRHRSRDGDHRSRREFEHERPAKRQRRDDHDDRGKRADRTRDLVVADRRTYAPTNSSHTAQSSTFKIDLVGDPSNLKYRSLHKYDVPAYRRSGRSFVLGATNYRIDRRQSDEKSIVLVRTHHVDSERKDPVDVFKVPASSKTVLIRPMSSADNSVATQKDFVALGAKQRRTKEREREVNHVPAVSDGDHDTSSENESLDQESSEETYDDPRLRAIKEQNIKLQRQVEADPKDVNNWNQLIEHQAAVLGLNDDKHGAKLTSQQQRSLADIRLTIYDKALSNFGPDHTAYVRLWQGLLTEGARVWDVRKQDAKWEDALQKTDGHLELWLGRLTFVQSNAAAFTFEKCRALFIEALNSARRHSSRTSAATIVIHIFLRMTVFFRSSGYHELAEAPWQAVLELRFCPPEQASKDLPEVLEPFLAFWDSEAPRIGEAGARGWTQAAHGDQSTSPSCLNQHISVPDLSDNSNETLRDREKRIATLFCHPGRTLDDEGEDDLYHTILVNDLRAIPFDPMMIADPSLILSAFLRYLGLPPVLGTCNATPPFFADPLTNGDDLVIPPLDIAWIFRALDVILEAFPENIDLAEYYLALRTHFTSSEDKVTVDTGGSKATTTGDMSSSNLPNSPDTIYLSLLGPVSSAIATASTFFDAKSSRKAAKKLLKKHSSCIRLYNAYALMELKLGNVATVKQVWISALQIGEQIPSELNETVHIWHSWLHHALRGDSTFKSAIRVLARIDESLYEDISRDLTANIILRVRRHLTEGRDASLLAQNPRTFVRYADLLAILEYLHHDQNLNLALTSYNRSLTALSNSRLQDSTALEELLQYRSHLLSLHMRSVRVYKPATIRGVLLQSIKLFPNNMTFMNLFIENEKRFNIDDRVRDLFVQMIENESTNNIPLCARYIEFEKHRSKLRNIGGANVRAAFERVLSTPLSSLSQDFWTGYVEYDIELGEHERAKNVFFRGLQCLPGCKWYILMGFSDLKALSREEKQGLLKLLMDKEIRMHQDIEDMQV